MSSSAERIWVYGASGHGKVVAGVARSMGKEVAGYIDDGPPKPAHTGLPVLRWEEFLQGAGREQGVAVALGVGHNHARQRIAERVLGAGLPLPTLVHASAVIAPSVVLGPGVVVMAGAVVNEDAHIGAGCILNTGSITEHDARFGDYILFGPNAAVGGTVTIGSRTLVGVGASILPNLTIGEDVVIGVGAAVVRDVPNGLTVVGVPARPIEKRR